MVQYGDYQYGQDFESGDYPLVDYCLPIDALRNIDSSLDQSDFGDNFSMPISEEAMLAHIEAVESEFEQRATPLTPSFVVNEYHEGIRRDYGWTVYLENENIVPFNSGAGDKVEIRVAEDSWKDVTDESTLDPDSGVVEIDQRFVRVSPGRFIDDTNFRVRVTYRYGNTGDESGETNLTETLDGNASLPTTVGVSDASVIRPGETVLLGDDEYVLISEVNTSSNTITIAGRGLRGTNKIEHSVDTRVGYMPMEARDAIASGVASRIIQQDDFLDVLNEGVGDSIDNQTKVEDLRNRFEELVGRYSSNAGYV